MIERKLTLLQTGIFKTDRKASLKMQGRPKASKGINKTA